jgi:hypothetical protein
MAEIGEKIAIEDRIVDVFDEDARFVLAALLERIKALETRVNEPPIKQGEPIKSKRWISALPIHD